MGYIQLNLKRKFTNLDFTVNNAVTNDGRKFLHEHSRCDWRPTTRRLDKLQQADHLLISITGHRWQRTLARIGRNFTQNVSRFTTTKNGTL